MGTGAYCVFRSQVLVLGRAPHRNAIPALRSLRSAFPPRISYPASREFREFAPITTFDPFLQSWRCLACERGSAACLRSWRFARSDRSHVARCLRAELRGNSFVPEPFWPHPRTEIRECFARDTRGFAPIERSVHSRELAARPTPFPVPTWAWDCQPGSCAHARSKGASAGAVRQSCGRQEPARLWPFPVGCPLGARRGKDHTKRP